MRLWVRIPPGAWVFVRCDCCVLSGRVLCDGLITRPEESYRLWCVVVCDLETSWMRRPWPTGGLSHQKQTNKQTNKRYYLEPDFNINLTLCISCLPRGLHSLYGIFINLSGKAGLSFTWFQTLALFWMLYALFWVIPWRLNFIFRRFGTLCSILTGK